MEIVIVLCPDGYLDFLLKLFSIINECVHDQLNNAYYFNSYICNLNLLVPPLTIMPWCN